MHLPGILSLSDEPAVSAARSAVWQAQGELADVRRRVAAIGPATDWQARAAEAYRQSLAAFVDDVTELGRILDLCDAVLGDAQRCLANANAAAS